MRSARWPSLGCDETRGRLTVALHEQSVGASNEWYTPPHVFEAMGATFDLDVAAPRKTTHADQWCDAKFTADSLIEEWFGFVWMNPPFGRRNGLVPWLEKFLAHGNGVALVPDRTSAPWFRAYAPRTDAMLLVAKKLKFIRADGTTGKSPAQGTALLAAGTKGCQALRQAESKGLGSLWLPV